MNFSAKKIAVWKKKDVSIENNNNSILQHHNTSNSSEDNSEVKQKKLLLYLNVYEALAQMPDIS